MAGSSGVGSPITLEVPSIGTVGDNNLNLASARTGSLTAITRSGATSPRAPSTAGGGGASGTTWANARQVQESAIVAAVRRQLEALEEKLTLQLSMEIVKAHKHGDRLRDSGEARLDSKIDALEQQQQRLEKRLSEVSGNVRSLSEELQHQMRRADQLDARAWGWRQKLEDDLRPALVELEQNCQQANSSIRIAKAGSEEVLKAYNSRISRIESLVDERFAQANDLGHSLMNVHNRLLQVEDTTPMVGRAGTKQIMRDPSTSSATAQTNDQAFAADLGKHWTDVLQLAESLRQEFGDLRARVEMQEESNKHLRTQWQAKDQLIRGMRDRLEHDNWESRFKELQARLVRMEQGRLLDAEQHLGALMQNHFDLNGCEREKGGVAWQADMAATTTRPPLSEWQTLPNLRADEVSELQRELQAVREPPLPEKTLWPDTHMHGAFDNNGGSHCSELMRTQRTEADRERNLLQPDVARAIDSTALPEVTARHHSNIADSGSGFNVAHEDISAEVFCVYPGFTEHAYRLVFPFEDHFAPDILQLLTVMPSGVVETKAMLEPQKEGALIAFTYPQSISDEVAESPVLFKPDGNVDDIAPMDSSGRILRDTPFVWRRKDGTNALVQTWPTTVNEQFRNTFEISKGTNPNSNIFQPQAVSEFQETMVRLFGPAAANHSVLFCHKKTENTSPAVVGTSEEVLAHLAENPVLMRKLAILSVDREGVSFVSDGTDGDGNKFEKHFTMTEGEQCVVYRKIGWDTMGCTKPLQQFLRDAELHQPSTVEVLDAKNIKEETTNPDKAQRVAELEEEERRWAELEEAQQKQKELPRALPMEPVATALHAGPTEPVANLFPRVVATEPVASVVHSVPTEPVANVLPMSLGAAMHQEQPVTGVAAATATAAEEERLLTAEAVVAIAERAAEEAAVQSAAKVTPGSWGLRERMPVKGLAQAELPEGSDSSSVVLE